MRLTWTPRGDGAYSGGGSRGKAGSVSLFSTVWDHGEKPWLLLCSLPGYDGKRWRQSTEAEAFELAEKVLQRWLESTYLLAECKED